MSCVPDISWFDPDLREPAWGDPRARTISFQIDGTRYGYLLFFILHAGTREESIRLPAAGDTAWYRVVDTSLPAGEDFMAPGAEVSLEDKGLYQIQPRSVAVLVGKPLR